MIDPANLYSRRLSLLFLELCDGLLHLLYECLVSISINGCLNDLLDFLNGDLAFLDLLSFLLFKLSFFFEIKSLLLQGSHLVDLSLEGRNHLSLLGEDFNQNRFEFILYLGKWGFHLELRDLIVNTSYLGFHPFLIPHLLLTLVFVCLL